MLHRRSSMNQSNSLVPVCPAFVASRQLRTTSGLPFAEHVPHAGEERAVTPCQQTVPEPVGRRLVFRLNLLVPNILWNCGAGQRWPTPGGVWKQGGVWGGCQQYHFFLTRSLGPTRAMSQSRM